LQTNNNSKTTQIMKRIYLQSKERNLLKVLSTTMLVLALSFQSNAQTLKDVIPPGKYFGTIYPDNPNQTVKNTAAANFNAMVTENLMKMGSVIKSGAGYDYANRFPQIDATELNLTNIENYIAFCEANGMRVRGHALLWYSQAPSWLNTLKPSGADINAFMQNYITALVTQYAGRINEWDVANEMLSNSTNGYRTLSDDGTTPVWFTNIAGVGQAGTAAYNTALDNLMTNCFKWAHTADPTAKLFYNDYSIESTGFGNKPLYAFNLVKRLISNDAPIDGIGFQSHFAKGNFIPSSSVAGVVANIQKYATINSIAGSATAGNPIEVTITEFDIRSAVSSPMTDNQKYTAYNEMIKNTLAEPNCNSFLIWGLSECCSWLPSANINNEPVPNLLWKGNAPNYVQNGTPTSVDANGDPSGAWRGAYDALNGLSILGVNDFAYNNKLVTISPNPATNTLTISGLTSEDKSFVVTDILGKNILKRTVISDSDTTIDVSQLQSGLYFLKTVSGKSAKIIKK
jgi:GH35 family endo-1,4-beta-xylanase